MTQRKASSSQPAAGRQQRRCQHRRGHQRHRHQHHPPPPVFVADVAERDRAQRPHQISDGEPAERQQQRAAAAAVEHAGKDRSDIEVEREIVPFDDGRESGDRKRARREDRAFVVGRAGHRCGRSMTSPFPFRQPIRR